MVGYVLSKFPELSTTFILNELLELEGQGVPLRIFSLRPPTEPLVHQDFAQLKSPISYLPGLRQATRLLSAHRPLRGAAPSTYRRTLAEAVSGGYPKGLWRFLQAGYIATESRRGGLTHLHAHFAHYPATVAMFAAELAEISFSFTAHAIDLFTYRGRRRQLARKLEAAAFAVTVSDYNMEFLRAVAPAAKQKLVLVRNGIDLSRFRPASPPARQLPRILCVARLVEKKGIAVLIEACRLLRQRGVGFECEIVGEGPLRTSLEAQIRRSGLSTQVRLLGSARQEEVQAHYRAAHCFALPCVIARDGDRDGLPTSLVEAMACELPVVTTPVTGIPELLHDNQNGLLVPPGDAEALAGALARILADPALSIQLGKHARAAVAERFDRRFAIHPLRARFLERDAGISERLAG